MSAKACSGCIAGGLGGVFAENLVANGVEVLGAVHGHATAVIPQRAFEGPQHHVLPLLNKRHPVALFYVKGLANLFGRFWRRGRGL